MSVFVRSYIGLILLWIGVCGTGAPKVSSNQPMRPERQSASPETRAPAPADPVVAPADSVVASADDAPADRVVAPGDPTDVADESDGGAPIAPLRARMGPLYLARVRSFLTRGFACPEALPRACNATFRITLDDGKIVASALTRSCGIQAMDDATRAHVAARRASGDPPPPPPADPQAGTGTLSVEFRCR